MLPPSMGYEVGKGREFELEQKAARRRLMEEALDARRQPHPPQLGLIARLLAFLRKRRQVKSIESPAGRPREEVEQFRERLAG